MDAMVETNQKTKQDKNDSMDSVSGSVLIFWILPVLCIAVLSRFAVDTGPPFRPQASRPVALNFDQKGSIGDRILGTSTSGNKQKTKSSEDHPYLLNKPDSYQEVVRSIGRRRLDFKTTSTEPSKNYAFAGKSHEAYANSPTAPRNPARSVNSVEREPLPPRGASSDPERIDLMHRIEKLRKEYHSDKSNILSAVRFADSLRFYDVQYHDGGSMQQEAITTYKEAISLVQAKRMEMQEVGEETNRALSGISDLNEEVSLDYEARSIDGILCALFTALGKTFFMANMFGKAVEAYSEALNIEPYYLDAMSARGSSRIILGDYSGAGEDFSTVIERDTKRRFQDVFTGLARVLQAKEDAVPGGWEPMISVLRNLVVVLEGQNESVSHPEGRVLLSNSLARLYHVLYNYHDYKTKDTAAAWDSLAKAYKYKMSALPPWNAGFEAQKIQATKQIFRKGFWPDVGSQTSVPIFIIGFVRSGSTLLERVLDAHSQIVGTGENSVFNGQLDSIRNKIVESSMLGDTSALANVIQSLADGVVTEMRSRWNMVAAEEERAAGREEPARLVDKMLTNYYNVGFIHMLFPNALILHVAREPMDTLFSAFKHEFPPGPLDYTSSFDSLAELYLGYRDLVEHWDNELPGRVTHIRYEDMVHDMPGIAKAIINATGLEWDDGVLEFHKKKQAVNTLSTTQVRKNVYKDSLQAWRKYEKYLEPLAKALGDRTRYDLKTTLPSYSPNQISDAIDEL